MGRSRLVRPDTIRLPISDGDWILIKSRLNAGEQRRANEQSLGPDGPDGKPTTDLIKAGLWFVRLKLLDWSLGDTDPSLVIRKMPEADVFGALDAIDQDTFVEILRAMEAHDDAQRLARDEEKKILTGSTTA